jgi:pyruvate/2-oxoglutarate/acetoin dehydrogenase E1 component
METIAASVRKTGRLVCVQESPAAGSWGATVIAHIAEHAFDALDAPPALIAADDTPIPYSGSLEDLWMPTEERIADGIRRVAAL